MAQNPKGGGLSSTFGGASSAQFGVQRTNDFMEKTTWTLGGTIVLLCLLSVILTAKPKVTANPAAAPAKTEAPAKQNTPASQSAPVQNAPAQPAQTPAGN